MKRSWIPTQSRFLLCVISNCAAMGSIPVLVHFIRNEHYALSAGIAVIFANALLILLVSRRVFFILFSIFTTIMIALALYFELSGARLSAQSAWIADYGVVAVLQLAFFRPFSEKGDC